MLNPRVSVLMPCYNVEKYVAEAVESILSQTFTDFELILLDDCSVDQTAEIVKRFKDDRIIYHKNDQNLGLVDTLNLGLQLAKGELIARMDSDDISLPERLDNQVKFLDENPDVILCSAGMLLFGAENGVWIRDKNPEDIKITMMFYSPILHASSIFRKKVFLENNLTYKKETFPAEDYDLWSRAVFFGKLVNIPEVLYKYRIHDFQTTRTVETREKATKQVQSNFIKRSLPSANKEDIDYWASKIIPNSSFTKKEILQSKVVISHFIEANKKDTFFDQRRLKFRLKRYYQANVFKFVKENRLLDFCILKELRFLQIVKLIINKP